MTETALDTTTDIKEAPDTTKVETHLKEEIDIKVKKTENLNITANLDNMSHKDIEGRLKEIFGGDIIDAKYDDV